MKHWVHLPWNGALGRDDEFRLLEESDVAGAAELGLEHFDDIAVLVLFSVFEAEIRKRVLAEIRTEAEAVRHPTLQFAVKEAQVAIEEGSFFRVMEPYKTPDLADLVEEVNQVRRYRNWVAHGRGNEQPPFVTPRTAFQRLGRFLELFPTDSRP